MPNRPVEFEASFLRCITLNLSNLNCDVPKPQIETYLSLLNRMESSRYSKIFLEPQKRFHYSHSKQPLMLLITKHRYQTAKGSEVFFPLRNGVTKPKIVLFSFNKPNVLKFLSN